MPIPAVAVRRFPLLALMAVLSLVTTGLLRGSEPAADPRFAVQVGPNPTAVAFFETKIRPILKDHCWKCHGTVDGVLKKRGGLLLDSLDHVLAGGDEGAAVIPGDSSKGLLMAGIRYQNQDSDLDMPPKGKLPDAVIADFAHWIDIGAPWPVNDTATTTGAASSTPATPAKVPQAAATPLLGKLHPAIIHMPIAALLLAVLTEALRWWRKGDGWRDATDLLILVGTGAAIAAVTSGTLLAGDQDPRLLARHEFLGWMTLVGAVTALALAVISRWQPKARLPLAAVLLVTAAVVSLTGHLGGEMVHGAW